MKLGLVIDLDTCVGCQACATACKQWNTSGTTGPLTDTNPYSKDPEGVWFNRIRTFEVEASNQLNAAGQAKAEATDTTTANPDDFFDGKTVHFPMSCLHCESPECVTVCPTGASYKRPEDGIVLIDQDKCMGCNLCAWACPYGARELDSDSGTMKKCTLCIDRIYDTNLPENERQPACVMTCPTNSRVFGDFDDPNSAVSQLTKERNGQPLLPELGYQPVNQYLPPRPPKNNTSPTNTTDKKTLTGGWINKLINR